MDHEVWAGLEPTQEIEFHIDERLIISMPETNFMALMENCNVKFAPGAKGLATGRYNQIKKRHGREQS